MTNDPKFAGGGEEYAPQPVMRPAPQGFQPQPAAPLQVPPQYVQAPQPPPVQPYAPPPAEHYAQPVYAAPPAPHPVAPPAMPAAPAASDDAVVVLSRAYRAHGDSVQTIRFRKPTAKDIRKAGWPMRNAINSNGVPCAIEELPEVAARYMSLLSIPPIPPSTVDEFDLDDFAKCSAVVTSFFLG
jgi:hypothetical protein